MEDLIAAYPKEFFPRKDLVFKDRQGSFSGVGRFDLLFEDEHHTKVLMELKAVPAKYEHADQLGKYQTALEQRGEGNVVMWLVAPLIPKPVRDCLDRIGIEYTEIHEAEFRAVAERHNIAFDGEPEKPSAASLRPPTAQRVTPSTQSIGKDLPPEGFKDLRQWHPTREQFEAHVAKAGDTTDDGSVLTNTTPMTLIRTWVQQTQMHDGTQLLRHVHGDYYRWGTNYYRKVEQRELRQEWYNFFTDKPVKVHTNDGGVKVVTLSTDRKFMGDLDDAASAHCYVRVEADTHEPFLIKTGTSMDLTRAVVFQNGILYIADDRLAPLSPDVFLTSTLPYDYHPGMICPKWLWFVGDIFNGDQECINLLQEWFGYSLIASNHMQSMMFFFGVPGSGKSTTAGILRSLLGTVRCCGASTDNFKGMFGRESLLNKYMAIMSESRDTGRSDIDKLLQTWKAITGGDVMNVARKYKAAVDTRLFCRLTYVANEAIPFDDVSQAMAGRTNLLYFANNYRKRNPDRILETKLQAEIPGIAIWAVEGLKRLLANDKFTVPEASQVHLASLAEITNPIGVMLCECTRLHIGSEFMAYRVECNTLYDLWKAWCDETRTKTSLGAIGFGMKLAHMERPIVRRRIEEAGKRVYVYQGLSIRPEAYERYLKR
jgi:P4 family phage/plasmid primase-like protien